MTNERAIQILEILISIDGDVIIEGVYKEALEMAIRSLQQEQPCDTCTNDKGCVTCKDGELWEGKEQPSEDLEKAVISIWKCRADGDASQLVPFSFDEVVELMKSGAEWQKEQMLKEAVEVDVADLNGDIYNYCIEEGLTDEDKVKIIIVKEDKE